MQGARRLDLLNPSNFLVFLLQFKLKLPNLKVLQLIAGLELLFVSICLVEILVHRVLIVNHDLLLEADAEYLLVDLLLEVNQVLHDLRNR